MYKVFPFHPVNQLLMAVDISTLLLRIDELKNISWFIFLLFRQVCPPRLCGIKRRYAAEVIFLSLLSVPGITPRGSTEMVACFRLLENFVHCSFSCFTRKIFHLKEHPPKTFLVPNELLLFLKEPTPVVEHPPSGSCVIPLQSFSFSACNPADYCGGFM